MTQINKNEKNKSCDISDLMETFGKYQFLQYSLVCFAALLISMTSIHYIFTAADMEYRCQIDECDDANSTAQFPNWWPDRNIDRCSRPLLKSGEAVCTNNSFTGEVAPCDHWIYESNNTIVAELNLACQPWKSNMVGTIHNLGMLVSMVVSGWMSDKFGRKRTLLFCLIGGTVGHIKTFVTSFTMYAIIEFVEASITGGCYSVAVVLLLEITGKKYRVYAGVIFAYAIYLGEGLFVFIAMFVPYWKTIIRIINGPCILFIFLTTVIHESPRWQIVSGKVENAKKVMKNIAETNKLNVNYEELANINESEMKEKFEIKNHEIKESLLIALKSKEINKRLLVACMARFTTNFVYYGMFLNTVWLPGDKYLNLLLSTLMSFVGETLILYLMNKVGRRIPLLIGCLVCGALCIMSGLTPPEYKWVKLSMFMIAKVIIAGCFTGAITYAMELFPTSVRGSLLGLAAFASQVGGMLAPLTPILNSISEVLPPVLFSCPAIITGLLLCLTPETKDMPLNDTIEQVENNSIQSKCKVTIIKDTADEVTTLENVAHHV